MSRKAKPGRILVVLLVAGVTVGGPVLRQRIEAGKRAREAHFVTIHFLCVNAWATDDPDAPQDLGELIAPYGGAASGLLDPFPDGLLLERDGPSFRLEEPQPRRVSIFRSDRLIATDRRWPRWEDCGELARKFRGQEVPPPGYQ